MYPETEGPKIIEDQKSKDMYYAGFSFAINYLHAIMPKNNKKHISQNKFAAFVALNFGRGVDSEYFANNPILPPDPPIYEYPLCPAPGGGCMECPDPNIRPIND